MIQPRTSPPKICKILQSVADFATSCTADRPVQVAGEGDLLMSSKAFACLRAAVAAWPAAEVAALCERHGLAPKLDLTPS